MRLFDTHCHLDDEQFTEDLGGVMERARSAGLVHLIAVATTAASSENCCRLAEENDMVSASVGIQPNYVSEADPGDWDRVVELSRAGHVVAIGETGLDRYWDHSLFDLQQDYFDRHLKLSRETGKPFIVHMRDCEQDIVDMLAEASRHGPLHGVMHSFTGSSETMRRCLELGMYVSFAGMVTFKKSVELREVARLVPRDRLLIETDAPYLSPHPARGQRPNEPALIVHTAQCLADLWDEPVEVLAEETTRNACRLFGIRF